MLLHVSKPLYYNSNIGDSLQGLFLQKAIVQNRILPELFS
jgi:hypothetical protein